MTKYPLILLLGFPAVLGPAPARAEDGPAAAPPTAAPTPDLESLHLDLRRLAASQAAELQALQAELAQREADTALSNEREAVERERLLRVYGFADLGLRRNTTPQDPVYASRFESPLTFYLGRLNFYFDSHPAQDFRFLAETRFSLYPNGTPAGIDGFGRVVRNSTLVGDVSSPNPSASVSWGGIILERAVMDWTRYPLFSVRIGMFLTPFGIYNVDHGTPTLISIGIPLYLNLNWVPVQQLGVQVFGSRPLGRWELGYAATVSNAQSGRITDNGDSKTYGGRLYARRQGELRLLLGLSGIRSPYRQSQAQFGMDASGNITFVTTRVVESVTTTVGGDLSVDYAGLRVRSELVFYQNEYTDGKRDVASTSAAGGLNPDERDVNWSVLVAHRFGNLELYLQSEIFHCSPTLYLGTNVWVPGAGFNFYFRPNVILKGNWLAPRFYKNGDPDHLAARQNFHTFNALLTWAF